MTMRRIMEVSKRIPKRAIFLKYFATIELALTSMRVLSSSRTLPTMIGFKMSTIEASAIDAAFNPVEWKP